MNRLDMRWLRTMAAVGLLLGLGPLVAACETSEGFGRDLQSLGTNIEDEAEEAQ